MKKGSTVIFNSEYIDEIVRHKDIAKQKYEVENSPELKARLKQDYDNWENKLAWAEEFQDSIDTFINLEFPNMVAIKTMGGYEYPARYLQVI